MQARLTTALAESDALVAANRKLIKEEADARTAAERARYEAAAASASCEHAVQDRQILEERLQVVQQRAKEADAAREQSAKQLRVCIHLSMLICSNILIVCLASTMTSGKPHVCGVLHESWHSNTNTWHEECVPYVDSVATMHVLHAGCKCGA